MPPRRVRGTGALSGRGSLLSVSQPERRRIDLRHGRARLRSAAVIRLLLHNALPVDEALGADIADLGSDRGHQVLTVLGKGNRRAKVALTRGR